LQFLNNNNLLSSNTAVQSNISGNIHSRKIFSDDWQWSTRSGSNGTGTYNGYFTSVCASGASFEYFTWLNNTGSGFCAKYVSGLQTSIVTGLTTSILPQCQAMHMACDLLPLPVELMKFEVN
jgi:hypothetical protein